MDFSKLSKYELEAMLKLVYEQLKTAEQLSEKNSNEYAEKVQNRESKYPYQTGYLISKINTVLEFIDYNKSDN